jgi:hypothetical protein
MTVVFDEVVSQVESASEQPQPQPQQEQGLDQMSSQEKLSCWQQQQAIVLRRQQRLEAD